jgi:succinate dehydrogenase / fumarate reductase, cytochrome b subunit
MAVSLTKENYVLHRIHSLTGVVPVGYYMVQHLALNTFSIGGASSFDSVIEFFEAIPKHILLAMEVFVIWIPMLFHAIYGIFIASRAENNVFAEKYKYAHNRMFWLQRASGIFIFGFLIYHVSSTTILKYIKNDPSLIKFAEWHSRFQQPLLVLVYGLGIAAASYHLGYGIWNFCIRWGITVSEKAQTRIMKISGFVAVALTLMGWAAVAGFIINKPTESKPAGEASVSRNAELLNVNR